MLTQEEKLACDKRAEELRNDERYQMVIGDIKSTVANIRVTQEERIRESNRNHEKADGTATKNAEEAAKQMKTSEEHKAFVNTMVCRLKEIEDLWVEHLKSCIKRHDVYNRWLSNVSGLGPALSGDLLAEFKVDQIYYIGQMFQYAGIVGNTRRKRGEVAKYNVYLKKRLLGVLPGSLLKARSPYSVYYYEYRIRMIQRWMNSSTEEKKNLSLGHQHMMANRWMIQRFIKDYYCAFRTIMNIPVIKSYEEEKLGVVHVGNSWTTPEMFIDMDKDAKKDLKDKTVAKIKELKEQLDNLVKQSGIKSSESELEDCIEDESEED